MKYVVLLGDGMADYPLKQLGGLTPLSYAQKPNMNRLAKNSVLGMVKTIPDGFPPGSDVANLSVLGYAPEEYYTGRSPLEAVSLGVELGENDVSLRCNLVTLSAESDYQDKTMVDYSSEEITSDEAALLIKAIDDELGSQEFHFYPGVSYRHCLVWKNGLLDLDLTPPHDISDQKITRYLPKGKGVEVIFDLMKRSTEILERHPVNIARLKRGLRPATSIWLWGQGKKPALTLFKEKYTVEGAVVCAVDLIKGLGICAGLEVVNVPGVTGNIHTNFQGKADAAVQALKDGKDFVYIHVEAPDEAGHQGNINDKLKAIEIIDEKVLGTILTGLESLNDDFRLMVLPDHPTPISIKTHTAEIVPFMIYDSRFKISSFATGYDEVNARETGVFVESGPELMARLIKG
ncbi:MAG: cofactor-independent phosphoglycerate mutase [Desulfitobacteriaceae bacterium]|nr:cofactor-independent phosphoglycerate mutase [Desulfitobacteriaceae bacterium]